jgi:uncharacterized protein (TIGR02265 family)
MHPRDSWNYQPVDSDHHVDAETLVARLPRGATVKGMFLEHGFGLAKRVGLTREQIGEQSGVPMRRYLPFLDYPYADYIRTSMPIARAIHPRVKPARALRQLGLGLYPMFADTVLGRVIFGALERDAGRVLPMGLKGWQLSINFGQIEAELLGPRHVRYHFTDMPALLDTMSLGVVEGALTACGVRGTVLYAEKDPANGSYDIRWE